MGAVAASLPRREGHDTRLAGLLGKAFRAFFELNADGVQKHRNQGVLPDRKKEIEELSLVPRCGKCGPRRVRNDFLVLEFVRRLQKDSIAVAPPRGVRAERDALDFFVRE